MKTLTVPKKFRILRDFSEPIFTVQTGKESTSCMKCFCEGAFLEDVHFHISIRTF